MTFLEQILDQFVLLYEIIVNTVIEKRLLWLRWLYLAIKSVV